MLLVCIEWSHKAIMKKNLKDTKDIKKRKKERAYIVWDDNNMKLSNESEKEKKIDICLITNHIENEFKK